MKNRSFAARALSSVLLSAVTLGLVACGQVIYKVPQYNFAGRAIPPSQLLQRVLASFTANGSSGGLEILDGLRDIRSNVQNTIPVFPITGYSGGNPNLILNYPEQEVGYVFSSTDGSVAAISYAKETAAGSVASFPGAPSIAGTSDGSRFAGASEGSGQLVIATPGGTIPLNLPNVDKVTINRGNTVILAMQRNSNLLYRVIRLNSGQYQTSDAARAAIGPSAADCQPSQLPLFCVVQVPGTYDRPVDAYFSLDGNLVYILNCGPECGGTTASVTALQEGALTQDIIPTPASNPSPIAPLPAGVTNPILVPGGVTTALSDGVNLYLAGQAQQTQAANGSPLVTDPVNPSLFTGYLTTLNLTNYAVSNPVSIPDGFHSKLLFADDNTLWVGSQQCANGKRQATGKNVNCLARIVLGAATLQPTVIPANVVPGGAVTVGFPNQNGNKYYYGSLTGLCWVQLYHKVYTAYGGQVHAFSTVDGSEIDNTNITIQGTVLDVAYMDALTNSAN